MKIYCGCGSRETPNDVLEMFIHIGMILAERKYILRSGGAEGADIAFEQGCDLAYGDKEIYIPWKNFNGSDSNLIGACNKAISLASTIHSAWDKCSTWAKVLHGRNCYQILGKSLDKPVDFVICWTHQGLLQGGTSTAIKLANKHNIKVYNFGKRSVIKDFEKEFDIQIKSDIFDHIEF